MQMTTELANKVFDILETKGNYEKEYIDHRRADFMDNMTTGYGAWEHWYSTEDGSSITIYFRSNMAGKTVFTVNAETINVTTEQTLVEDLTKAFNELSTTEAAAVILH